MSASDDGVATVRLRLNASKESLFFDRQTFEKVRYPREAVIEALLQLQLLLIVS